MSFVRSIVVRFSLLPMLVACHGAQSVVATTPAGLLAAASVVNQLPLDLQLYGYHMAVDGCTAYVAMQSNLLPSKLAVVNLCGSGSTPGAAPVFVSVTPGTFAVMNGVTKSGTTLYVTYGWATNPLEVWSVAGATPKVLGCAALFSDAGYTSCGQAANGYGALYGGPAVVAGRYVYAGENSDDPLQAVQVVDVSSPAAPAKVPAPAGVSAGKSATGDALAGIWAVSGGGTGTGGTGTTLYVGTISTMNAATESVTITAYDTGASATVPVKLGVAWSAPVGFTIENMAAQGTEVVATLWNSSSGAVQIAVLDFHNPAVAVAVAIAPTAGCIPGNRNFIALTGKYALFGCSSAGTVKTGIEVVDVSTVAAPVLVGQMASSLTHVDAISVQGRYVYATDDAGNLDTIDAGALFQ